MKTCAHGSSRLALILFAGLVLALLAWEVAGSAEPAPRLLDGVTWQRMTPDARAAFVWGLGNLVEYERTRIRSNPASHGESFIPLLVEGLRNRPIGEVVRAVDAWYAARPAELHRPVMDAIFQAVVLPALTAERQGGTRR